MPCQPLVLHEFHRSLAAEFSETHGYEIVNQYADWTAEYEALRHAAGFFDFGFRSRLCLTGADRARFLHGQVTNDVNRLRPGQGCYATLITAKGRLQSDLNVYCLPDELLLDFEPGYAPVVSARLEQFVIADDVQVVDVSSPYSLLSVQGPRAEAVVKRLNLGVIVPAQPLAFVKVEAAGWTESLLVNNPRLGLPGFDFFLPTAQLTDVARLLLEATKAEGGRPCGWQALEVARVEAAMPRYGQDMDETNLPLEAGLEGRAISFNKGCYIGQEVISRIKTYSESARALRCLKLADDLQSLPAKGDKLFLADKEVGYVTSAVRSPALKANIALGYVRKESNQLGNVLTLRTQAGESNAEIVASPFVPHVFGEQKA